MPNLALIETKRITVQAQSYSATWFDSFASCWLLRTPALLNEYCEYDPLDCPLYVNSRGSYSTQPNSLPDLHLSSL
jgi:hypothetical protein